ncbi:CdaR family transcriptional regulator [Ornithinibacillus halophilus]|uniref:Transcriptional regulator, CdaR family n=1 Tax=Ornithinibacillus halophilus TaxID=930117 RepID=A0A1M5GU45_9BACI|nr:sugar diacid recognition domain-containing protein [Ornithinibacillus halophilus]SHG07220.1 transcriptional regulator, CdaR family [Ornithinibacillus halophilus]
MNELFHSGKFYSSVVNEVRKLINEDVIITNEDGIIVASSDPSRMNKFHEGSVISMQKKENLIMTEELSEKLQGVRKGVCLPIMIDEQPIGVVGITGEPEVVEPVAMLVQKVAELFVQDSIIHTNLERQARELEFFVFDWLNNKEKDQSIKERSQFFNIHLENYERVVVLQTRGSSLQLSYKDINRLRTAWDQKGDTLFIRWGQDKILIILGNRFNHKPIIEEKLIQLTREMEMTLNITVTCGVGQATDYKHLHQSFEQAERACKVATPTKKIIFEEELQFDILHQALDEHTKNDFIDRTIRPLLQQEELLKTLEVWFQNDMSNQLAAKELHIHKNTLHYRLRRIEELTQLNLKKLHHLVILYLAYRFLVK